MKYNQPKRYEVSDDNQLLSVHNLGKSFGPVEALAEVNFEVEPGEVLGVVGQRGSGKSTLFHLLAGSIQPSVGGIFFEGERVSFRTPSQARNLGIETASQNPHLANNLSALDNIFLGHEICRVKRYKLFPDEGQMATEARAFLADFDLPPQLVSELPRSIHIAKQSIKHRYNSSHGTRRLSPPIQARHENYSH